MNKEENTIVKGKNLYDKLSKVQSCSKELLKDAHNTFQNYKYFTEHQAFNLLKPLLDQQGLSLIFADIYENPREIPVAERLNKVEKLEKEWIVQYWKEATLIDADKPEDRISIRYWCMGTNNHISKAKGSAETYGMKYFLQKFFLMPTADNEDPDKEYLTNIPITEEDRKKAKEILSKHGLGSGDKAAEPVVEKKVPIDNYKPGLKCFTCKSSLLYKPETKRYWCAKCNKETEIKTK